VPPAGRRTCVVTFSVTRASPGTASGSTLPFSWRSSLPLCICPAVAVSTRGLGVGFIRKLIGASETIKLSNAGRSP